MNRFVYVVFLLGEKSGSRKPLILFSVKVVELNSIRGEISLARAWMDYFGIPYKLSERFIGRNKFRIKYICELFHLSLHFS